MTIWCPRHSSVAATLEPTAWNVEVAKPGRLASLLEEIAEPVSREHDLAHDLEDSEVAHEVLRPGIAEGAGQSAADLARNAERAVGALLDTSLGEQARIRRPHVTRRDSEFASHAFARR